MQSLAHRADFSSARPLPPLRRFLARIGSLGAAKLDLESLPDHLKRDLGFLGGRETPPRDPLRD